MELDLVFEISKADPEVTAPVPVEGMTADGAAKELVAPGSTTGGIIEYSLDGENYSADIPTAADEGEYTVYYRETGDENYNDAAPQTVTAVIGEDKAGEKCSFFDRIKRFFNSIWEILFKLFVGGSSAAC